MIAINRKSLTVLTACFALAAVAAAPEPEAEVGEKAPDFTVADTDGKEHKLSEYTEQDKIVVLEWFNPGCPYVVRHYNDDFNTTNNLEKEYKDDNVVWLRVNSGAPGKQGAGLEHNRKIKQQWNIAGPILLDESGKAGRLYGATNTPQMAVIDADGVLRYWGALDDDPWGRKDDRVNYVEKALDAVIAGETVDTARTKAYGCSVKYSD
jgi:peroxiredoxin